VLSDKFRAARRPKVEVTPDLAQYKGSLPASIVDNEIYRYLPSVLVGTVDKLAIIARSRYFAHLVRGSRQECKAHGYTSYDECVEKFSGGKVCCVPQVWHNFTKTVRKLLKNSGRACKPDSPANPVRSVTYVDSTPFGVKAGRLVTFGTDQGTFFARFRVEELPVGIWCPTVTEVL
jgi:hypothetical protein